MTPAERRLLLALFRWARAAGVINVGLSHENPVWRPASIAGWRVAVHRRFAGVSIARGLLESPVDYRCSSITEVVDLLVVFGVVPARFSSAYRAGWYASAPGHLRSLTDTQYAEVLPAGLSGALHTESGHAA